jgi:ABC-type transport system involved in multi-copper enzyme maturation permease subunit
VFHVKQLRQVFAIASCTTRELVRNPAFLILIGVATVLVASSPLFALFHMGEQVKLVADLGLGTSLVIGLLVGVLGASWELSEELESLTIYAILSKPVSRASYVTGKYFGVLAAAIVASAVPLLILLLTVRALSADGALLLYCGPAAIVLAAGGGVLLWRSGESAARAAVISTGLTVLALFISLDSGGVLALAGRSLRGWAWALVPAYLGLVFQIAILTAVAVALSVRLSLAANLPITLAVFVLGQIVGEARAGGGPGGVIAYLLPDLSSLQYTDAVAERLSSGSFSLGAVVSADILAGAFAVAAAYSAGALLLAGALFSRRDVR